MKKMDEPRIPPNVFNQRLMVNEDQESSSSRQVKRSSSSTETRVVSAGEWITVLVLCFVNLINYMDRLTIAGKFNLFIYLFTADLFLETLQILELTQRKQRILEGESCNITSNFIARFKGFKAIKLITKVLFTF